MTDLLKAYRTKRDFAQTPEPRGAPEAKGEALSFVVQKHDASHLHYDFRLELEGTLKSWAIPKGPSLDPADKRMAVHVEDHPIAYGGFEGVIPQGHYGAGTVIVWDRGRWEPVGDAGEGYRAGKLKFRLQGAKLKGGWTLVRMHGRDQERQEPWLLIKERDDEARPASEFSVVDALPDSVLTGPKKAAKPAAKKAVAKKRGAPAAGDAKPVRVTHAERIVDEKSGTTKQQVVDYYVAAASRMLPHLQGRPAALMRAPAGVGGQLFFQKHAETLKIAAVTKLDPKLDPEHPPMIEIDSAEALTGSAQMNVIEFHTWNAHSARIERPDRMTFDLDPGSGVDWAQMQEAAQATHVLLDQLGLANFLKTSGGKGLHVVVPIAPRLGWDTVKDFSKAIVEQLVTALPDRLVAKSGPKNRVGKIFVDFLRNGRGATTVAAFSLRARPGLGVSVPCVWDELAMLTSGDHWNIGNAGERLESRTDPWADYEEQASTLTAAMKQLGYKRR